jgi:hypothetical protein
MKIDVEGHEVEVVRGFSDTLKNEKLRPAIIQFEYGDTYIPARHSLCEMYELLEPNGYSIGRLYYNGVDFKRYEFADDHYRMGNYIAVKSDPDLVKLLQYF